MNVASGRLLIAVVTKRRSPQTIGLECASPGIATVHAMLRCRSRPTFGEALAVGAPRGRGSAEAGQLPVAVGWLPAATRSGAADRPSATIIKERRRGSIATEVPASIAERFASDQPSAVSPSSRQGSAGAFDARPSHNFRNERQPCFADPCGDLPAAGEGNMGRGLELIRVV